MKKQNLALATLSIGTVFTLAACDVGSVDLKVNDTPIEATITTDGTKATVNVDLGEEGAKQVNDSLKGLNSGGQSSATVSGSDKIVTTTAELVKEWESSETQEQKNIRGIIQKMTPDNAHDQLSRDFTTTYLKSRNSETINAVSINYKVNEFGEIDNVERTEFGRNKVFEKRELWNRYENSIASLDEGRNELSVKKLATWDDSVGYLQTSYNGFEDEVNKVFNPIYEMAKSNLFEVIKPDSKTGLAAATQTIVNNDGSYTIYIAHVQNNNVVNRFIIHEYDADGVNYDSHWLTWTNFKPDFPEN